MKCCLYNGTIVLPDRLVTDHCLVMAGGTVERILPREEWDRYERETEEPLEWTDARGGYILPGLIDIHSDYVEGIIQPRPTSMMDFETSIYETERHLISHGITTIFHSLSLVKEKFDYEQMSVRKQENVDKLVKILSRFEGGSHLIRHRFHARYEIDNPDIYDYLTSLIEKGYVQELSFMDHTPGQGQYRDIERFSKSLRKWKGIRSEEEFQEFLEESRTKTLVSHEKLTRLAELAREKKIPLASHDDDTVEKLDFIEEHYQVGISEFPITMEVARKAHRDHLFVVAGAPNVMLGGSHSGNLNAREAIQEGCVDILCSDYYPAAMLQAAFRLWKDGVLTLPEAVRLISLNPARAVGMEREYGSLEPGKKADVAVISLINGYPAVRKCYVEGRLALQVEYSGYENGKGVA